MCARHACRTCLGSGSRHCDGQECASHMETIGMYNIELAPAILTVSMTKWQLGTRLTHDLTTNIDNASLTVR